jgi:protein-S-isoprenylcysteine O-methyltransferase Ste14
MPENPDHAQVILPPPVIFLGYLVSALVLQWVVPFPTPWRVPLRILGGVLVIAGLALGGSAFLEMMKAHTTPDAHQPSTALVTTGPYRFTRNPIYLGFLLIDLGFTLLAGTLWGLLLSPFLIGTITRWIIHAEEAYLGKKFKEEYQAYYSRVHQWI